MVNIAIALIVPQITALYPALIILVHVVKAPEYNQTIENHSRYVDQHDMAMTQIQDNATDVYVLSGPPGKSQATSEFSG
ncbi:hypothetical protein D9757_005924 [Collybiopsis confluens]|uniref:Uncharacterized protein n=1 Tax=Collybiopsis confluens TaxID=2823264 RepID=A0A8H5HN69_9AGAR|nr:hypothetical protein D9757_005924 [Collybiopsis confluens]